MKLLLRSVLLSSLCTLSSWSVSSEALVVSQSPDVSVSEGETVTITCCWETKHLRIGVKWLKNQTSIKDETITNQSQESPNVKRNCTVLSFQEITRKDSGRYVCKVTVEIPALTEVEGDGTTITVTDNLKGAEKSAGGPNTSVIAALAVVVPLFLVALACFFCLKRRQGQTARVIYEVPHTDSLDAEMDKQSTTSSRGSSQWCQVPLYDYFERVETKESG
uniref:Si:ch211-93g21.1 n=1 Tax=Iconisemion striatum TaxID=60296 RepID=A0A1A7Z020_9TELE